MAKKQFVVWYDQVETFKLYFEADDLKDARMKVLEIETGNQPVEWLFENSNGFEKSKGSELRFDTPEEVRNG
jgi:hypothetical protein